MPGCSLLASKRTKDHCSVDLALYSSLGATNPFHGTEVLNEQEGKTGGDIQTHPSLYTKVKHGRRREKQLMYSVIQTLLQSRLQKIIIFIFLGHFFLILRVPLTPNNILIIS